MGEVKGGWACHNMREVLGLGGEVGWWAGLPGRGSVTGGGAF